MSFAKISATLVIAGATLVAGSVASAQVKDGLECRYLSVIEQGFLANHVKYSERDKELATRTIEQYLKRIDPSKIYLTQSDVDQINKWWGNVFDKTKNKDCTFLDETQKLLLQRVKDRAEFAKTFLGKDYKFDPKTEFVYDPDKKPWPKDGN